MPLIDTHFHLDLYPDHRSILAEIERSGIYTVAVTNAPSVFRRSAELALDAHYVRTAVGLHPELAGAREFELALLDELLPMTRYVGEVGLDHVTHDVSERAAQRRVIATVLDKCAAAGDKVLTVHSRRAEAEVVAMIGEGFPGTVILHWFSGTRKVLEQAVAQGCYFSLNPAMMRSANGQRIAGLLPPDRVLTETDGPFVKVEGRQARPADVATVVSALSASWGLDTVATESRVVKTFKRALTPRELGG